MGVLGMVRAPSIVTVGILGLAGLLCGCSAFPTSGPYSWDVRAHNRIEGDIEYTLVPITDNVISILKANEPPDLSGAFRDPRTTAPQIKFGVGDIVGVRIHEASAGGLFIPNEAGARAGNFVDLPDQPVDQMGNIQVPYAGQIKAVDQTPLQVQETIVARLRNRAIDPQAVVTLREQRTSLVSVLGEVNTPARLPVTAAGDKVLDVITRAGGPKAPGHETYVRLVRNGREGTVSFLRVVNESKNNIFVQGNDTIFIYREPHSFVALGALNSAGGNGGTPQQTQINFDKEKLNMVEALGKAFGLNDLTADPASIFLYRLESKRVAAALGIDVSIEPSVPYYTKAPPVEAMMGVATTETDEGKYPVIYNLNLRDPTGFFHAQRFMMRNNDVIFASTASAYEMVKFLTVLRTFIATVREGNFMVQELKCRGAVGGC